MSIVAWLGFTVAAGAGATARFAVDTSVRRRRGADSPRGILVVNLVGCLALGVVVGLVLHHDLDTEVATVIGTGGLGAFTTFSTFTVEAVRLAQRGAAARAATYVVTSLLGGLAAASVGLAVAALW